MSKTAITSLTKVWRDRNISRDTKMRLVRTLIFSVFLNDVKTLSHRAFEKQKFDAFEMWCSRRMLRISWTAKRMNVSILKGLKVRTRLSTICPQRILSYFGHIARLEGDYLEKLIVTSKFGGKDLVEGPRSDGPIK